MERLELQANGYVFDAIASGPIGGRPLLLLHGFPQTSWSWHNQVDDLGRAGFRVLAFDQRGYSSGARPPRVDDYVLEELVSDVLAVSDSQGWNRFDLAGHDWGAVVAWAVAELHPGRIRTLTAVSVPHPAAFGAALAGADDDQPRRSSYIEVFRAEGGVAETALLGADGSGDGLRSMFAASGFPPGDEDVEVYVRAMSEPGALTAALNWYRAMSAESFAAIGPVTVPTLYVWSTEDVALGRKAAEDTVNWVNGPYRFEVLEGVSHWIPEAAPAELTRLLFEHLGANF